MAFRGATSAARNASTGLQALWNALGVKHRGKYPRSRLFALREFAQSTSTWQVCAVLALTPLPCLLVIAIFEVVPLSAPDTGMLANHNFFVREFMMYYVFSLALLQQFCWQVGPVLPMTTVRLIAIALLIAAFDVGFSLFAASHIGFPVPFTMQASAPSHLLLQVLLLVLSWRHQVLAKPALVADLSRAGMIFVAQACMVCIYPVYYHVFTLIPDHGVYRSAFVVLLLPLKLLSRRVFHEFTRKAHGGEEHTPQVIALNADVMSALFAAFCMQYEPSLLMTGVLVFAKVALSFVAFKDIQSAALDVTRLRSRVREHQRLLKASVDATASHTSPHVLDEVAEILSRLGPDPEVSTLNRRKSSRLSQVIQAVPGHLERKKHWCWTSRVTPSVGSIAVRSVHLTQPIVHTVSCDGSETKVASLGPHRGLTSEGSMLIRAPAETDKQAELEHLERLYATTAMRFLYMSESVALVDYVELIISVIYSTSAVTVPGCWLTKADRCRTDCSDVPRHHVPHAQPSLLRAVRRHGCNQPGQDYIERTDVHGVRAAVARARESHDQAPAEYLASTSDCLRARSPAGAHSVGTHALGRVLNSGNA